MLGEQADAVPSGDRRPSTSTRGRDAAAETRRAAGSGGAGRAAARAAAGTGGAGGGGAGGVGGAAGGRRAGGNGGNGGWGRGRPVARGRRTVNNIDDDCNGMVDCADPACGAAAGRHLRRGSHSAPIGILGQARVRRPS
jgi:hypothetical protein